MKKLPLFVRAVRNEGFRALRSIDDVKRLLRFALATADDWDDLSSCEWLGVVFDCLHALYVSENSTNELDDLVDGLRFRPGMAFSAEHVLDESNENYEGARHVLSLLGDIA
jgi:hypothetical protein